MPRIAAGLLIGVLACGVVGDRGCKGEGPRSCRDGPMQRTEVSIEPTWRARLGAADEYEVAVGLDTVMARAGNTLVGITPADGEERFRLEIADLADVVVAGEIVVASTLREGEPMAGGGVRYQGELVGVDASTGEERWRNPIATPHIDRFLVDGERVYFSASATATRVNVAHALDPKTGAIAWTRELPSEAELIAIESGRGHAIGDGVVTAIDLTSGEPAWERPVELVDENDGLAVAGSRVYVGFPWRFHALDASNGTPVWTAEGEGNVDSAVLHADGERAVIVGSRVFVHSDPPSPGPGDVGTEMIVFGGEGRKLAVHDVAITSDDSGRRSFDAIGFAGDRIAGAIEDRLQIYSLCDLAYDELSLGAAAASNIAIDGKAVYLVLAGGDLVRIDSPR